MRRSGCGLVQKVVGECDIERGGRTGSCQPAGKRKAEIKATCDPLGIKVEYHREPLSDESGRCALGIALRKRFLLRG